MPISVLGVCKPDIFLILRALSTPVIPKQSTVNSGTTTANTEGTGFNSFSNDGSFLEQFRRLQDVQGIYVWFILSSEANPAYTIFFSTGLLAAQGFLEGQSVRRNECVTQSEEWPIVCK